jgi:hypothetical protein
MKAFLLTAVALSALTMAGCDDASNPDDARANAIETLRGKMPSAPPAPPVSDATWRQVEESVGCDSKFTDEKQRDIFERDYKGRQVTWSGTATSISGEFLAKESVGNEGGTFRVYGLRDDPSQGEAITIRFTLTGYGCPGIDGRDGVIVARNAFTAPVSDVTADQAYNVISGNEFEARVLNHQVTWTGTFDGVYGKDTVFVKPNFPADTDFMVKLADGQSAYDLKKGKPITIRFVMRSNSFHGD